MKLYQKPLDKKLYGKNNNTNKTFNPHILLSDNFFWKKCPLNKERVSKITALTLAKE
ncbi:hypothetical protein [Spiroplasma endosymbiont of Stenodema calcarata]|uniref:hypothetical protein n=1 Tax=Spiroplasma endosymbiont of Stenodema calcarata TaxID=3139328 RepID=UPI003CCAD270